MRTHRLVSPQGDVVERPCSAWCRDGRHAAVWYGIHDPGPEAVGAQVVRANPGLTIVAVEPAGEFEPPADVLAHFGPFTREELTGYVVIYGPAREDER